MTTSVKPRTSSLLLSPPSQTSSSSSSSPTSLFPGKTHTQYSYDELNKSYKSPIDDHITSNGLIHKGKATDALLSHLMSASSGSLTSYDGYDCDADIIKFGVDKTPKAIEQKQSNKQFWRFVVMMICIVWSTNFAVIKGIFEAVPTLDASLYTAIRFSIAGLVMLPNTSSAWNKPELIGRCIIMGFFVFLGYFGQGLGMSLGSSANKSAFICSMNCVWVALLQIITSSIFKAQTWLSILLAICGVAILELQGSEPIALGDYWLILQPIGFGTGYVLLESLMVEYPEEATAITSFKLLVIALFSSIWAIGNGKSFEDLGPFLDSFHAIVGILYCALFTTVAAIWCQSIAFKKVSAKDVSIILCTEPIWATIFSALLVDEFLTFKDIVGAALIILGCIIDQVPGNTFLAYSQSCIRWPAMMCHGSSSQTTTSTFVHKGHDDLERIEIQEYKVGNTYPVFVENDDDDEEKMRKNVFIN